MEKILLSLKQIIKIDSKMKKLSNLSDYLVVGWVL